MARPNLYAVLGLERDASADSIRGAYRRLAKSVHPDVRGASSEPPFHQLVEAYEVLSDPERRQRYNAKLAAPERIAGTPVEAEPLASRRVSVGEGLRRGAPTLEDEFLDWTRRVAQGFHLPKSGRIAPLDIDVLLSPEEAAHGGDLPLDIPTIAPCRACGGAGRQWLYVCGACDGLGGVRGSQPVRIRIPAGVPDRSLWELPNLSAGLLLRLHIRIDARA